MQEDGSNSDKEDVPEADTDEEDVPEEDTDEEDVPVADTDDEDVPEADNDEEDVPKDDTDEEDVPEADTDEEEATENVEEEDDLIKSLKAARQKKECNCPPDIKTSDLITGLVRLLIFWNTADFPQFSMLMLRQYAKVAYICCYFQEISKFQRNL